MYRMYFIIAVLLTFSSSLLAQPLDTNLIRNYNAEAIGENTIPHWKPLQHLETWHEMAQTYGRADGEWDIHCDEKCGLPPNAGERYFRIPIDASNPHLGLKQEIDLEPFRDTLEERKMQFTLSGFIAGMPAMKDECSHGAVSVKFYDVNGLLLDTKEYKKSNHMLEIMTGEDRRMYKFAPFSLTDEVPKGSAKALVLVEGRLMQENCNGGYTFYDNLRFAITKGMYRKDVR